MNCRKGMCVTPKKPNLLSCGKIKKTPDPVLTGNNELKIGDFLKGLPIIGKTELLYICLHNKGKQGREYTECFQKKEHRLNLRDDFYYA